MNQIGNVVKTIFSQNIMEAAQEHHRLHTLWSALVEKVFPKQRIEEYKNKYSDDPHLKDSERKYLRKQISELTNLRKAAEHSAVKYVKGNTLYIQADHQGWIQILQTKQQVFLRLVNKEFPDLKISGIAFVLQNSEEIQAKEAAEYTQMTVCTAPAESTTAPASKLQTQNNQDNLEEMLSGVKDEEFKDLLRQLGQKVQSRQNQQ